MEDFAHSELHEPTAPLSLCASPPKASSPADGLPSLAFWQIERFGWDSGTLKILKFAPMADTPLLTRFRDGSLPQIRPFDLLIHWASSSIILNNLQKHLIYVLYLFYYFLTSTSLSPYPPLWNVCSLLQLFTSSLYRPRITSQYFTDVLLPTIPQFQCF